MDEAHRKLIEKRLRELGLTRKQLSQKLGQNDGYVSEMLRDKFKVPLDVRLNIAKELDLDPRVLGIDLLLASDRSPYLRDFQPDAVLYSPQPGHWLEKANRPLLKPIKIHSYKSRQ